VLDESRWSSLQANLTSVLRARKMLTLLAVMHAPRRRARLSTSNSWSRPRKSLEELATAEEVVVQLVRTASLLNRQHHATVADVAIMLGEIYRAFSRHAPLFGNTLIASVEKLGATTNSRCSSWVFCFIQIT
jgi:hypothetical protein